MAWGIHHGLMFRLGTIVTRNSDEELVMIETSRVVVVGKCEMAVSSEVVIVRNSSHC